MWHESGTTTTCTYFFGEQRLVRFESSDDLRRAVYVCALTNAIWGASQSDSSSDREFDQPSLERSGRDRQRELLLPVKKVVVAGNDPNSVVFSRQRDQVVIIGVAGCDGDLRRVRHLVRQNLRSSQRTHGHHQR